MRWSLIAAPLAALILAAAGTASAAPVRTEGGLVEGAAEGGLTVYKGVPFAAAPINSLRWRAPRTVVPWQDVKQTTAFALPCAQGGAAPSAEDCLYLNVWTPAAKAGARLPVMVWIYGGAMAVGATSDPRFDGASLAKRGVVVVSIAYRVGALRRLAGWVPTPLEHCERLEQLRALENGLAIAIAPATETPGPGVDTAEDLQRVAALLAV